jgi:hypothetical protein
LFLLSALNNRKKNFPLAMRGNISEELFWHLIIHVYNLGIQHFSLATIDNILKVWYWSATLMVSNEIKVIEPGIPTDLDNIHLIIIQNSILQSGLV